ncbi:MAG: pentapeptide repeat-containing protein, partial [Bacteroidota bacterium]
EAHFSSTLFRECSGEMSLFWASTIKRSRFENTLLRKASFEGIHPVDLTFRGCDLTNADMLQSRLAGTDLRGSHIDGLRAGGAELRGAIIDPHQTVAIALMFGLDIRDDDE